MPLEPDFAFSQGSLQDYADCARRFLLRYIRRLQYPALEAAPALEYEARTRQGDRFHKLVQQHLMGVPADLLSRSLDDDEELARWWRSYRARGLTGLPSQRQAEITLQTELAGRRLIAKYDLLALEPGGEAVIVDWKTWRKLPARDRLENRFQTIVYRYVLSQAGAHLYGGAIPPERISMVYCFVASDCERLSFAYSPAQMAADEAALRKLIKAIDRASDFPLTDDESRCRFCTYRSLCDRGGAGRLDWLDEEPEVEDEEELDLDFEQLAEIAF